MSKPEYRRQYAFNNGNPNGNPGNSNGNPRNLLNVGGGKRKAAVRCSAKTANGRRCKCKTVRGKRCQHHKK